MAETYKPVRLTDIHISSSLKAIKMLNYDIRKASGGKLPYPQLKRVIIK